MAALKPGAPRPGSTEPVVVKVETESERDRRERESREATILNLARHAHEKPPVSGLYIYLSHGRDDPDQDMDDWGYDGPFIGPLKWAHVTYNTTINLCFTDDEGGEGTGPLSPRDGIGFHDGLFYYDNKYYGDWDVELVEVQANAG